MVFKSVDDCRHNPDQLLRSVLLQDSKGKVQVILLDSSMLDLNILSQCTGRDFSIITATEVLNLCNSKRIKSIPDFPHLFYVPTIVDEKLNELSHYSFNSMENDGDKIVTINKEKFNQIKSLSGHAKIIAVSKTFPLNVLEEALESGISVFASVAAAKGLDEVPLGWFRHESLEDLRSIEL